MSSTVVSRFGLQTGLALPGECASVNRGTGAIRPYAKSGEFGTTPLIS